MGRRKSENREVEASLTFRPEIGDWHEVIYKKC
jgi:hypothetical protein